MSEVLTKVIVDCSTGVVAEVPLTGEEIAQRESDAQAAEAAKVKADAQAAADAETKANATAKLAALGLTAEEIAALSK